MEEKIASCNAFIWKVSAKLIPLEVTKFQDRDQLEKLFIKRIKRSFYAMFITSPWHRSKEIKLYFESLE